MEVAKKYPDLKIMEAFMYRHHPQWQRARQIVEAGSLGTVRNIQSFFSYYSDDPNNIRNMADIGGGGLMDIGCYNISISRFIFGQEPRRVVGLVDYDPQFKTDRLASAIMDFGNQTATFTCSTQLAPYQRVNIIGTTGRLEVEIPVNAPADKPCRLWLQTAGKPLEEILIETTNQYTIQGDLFSQAIQNNTPVPTPLEDAVANMRVIEAIFESGKTGGWVELA